ncbi:N-6 DNA methylase [Bacillus cereus group sp. BfR-BA-01346]|uniref:N-6 DNA methylase n=1 Tax=Bacillus cereus group sp. BfR-BA-01346 TaxID=2920309 RepID=UPI001F574935|nr:N-6 DNA methylase [Bacillus cereus group sp. BfR-BA-01346]
MNSKKRLKQYFTSEGLSNILVKSIDDTIHPQNIIDLSVGEGNLLKSAKSRWGVANLYGIDIDGNIIDQLRGDMGEEVELINEDALDIPFKKEYLRYFNTIAEGGFDLCLANPPYGKVKKTDLFNKDKMFPLELLFLAKYIEICRDGGVIAIILPNGVLTNSKYSHFREYLIQNVQVEKVISLPVNAFPEVSIKTEILILRKNIECSKKYFNIKFEKYNSKLNVEKVFEKKLTEKQLIERLDFDYHYPGYGSKVNDIAPRIKCLRLSDLLLSQSRGATEYGDKRKFEPVGIKYIHTTNLGDMVINFTKDEKFIDENSQMFKSRALLKVNDVIMVRVGKSVGKACVIHSAEDVGVASDCLYILRFNDADLAYYFTAIMQTEFLKSQINRMKYGSCSKLIRKTDVLNLMIPVVSSEKMKSIVEEVKELIDFYKGSMYDMEAFLERKELFIQKLEGMIRGRF